MSALALDPAEARRAAGSLARSGDAWQRTSFDLSSDGETWQLGHETAVHHVAAAGAALWQVSAFLRLAADAAERADVAVGASLDALAAHRMLAVAAFGGPVVPAVACLVDPAGSTFSPPRGDRGETGDIELRSPWVAVSGSPADRVRHLVLRALVDTGDPRQIRPDEFEVVRLDTGRYVVVLPGVTDLRSPDLGWSDDHRSVRDLDRAAVRSARSTAIADNAYARLVWDGLVTAGVPTGAELMVVGHSFGADTALDLAADPVFNGPDGYRVTHVVAAAYHSGPQLADVPASTRVLVLQNHRDLAVIAEAMGSSPVVDAVAARVDTARDLADLDLVGAAGHVVAGWRHDLAAAGEAVGFALDHVDDLARVAGSSHDPRAAVGVLAEIVTLEPRVEIVAPGHVLDVFEGGGDGAGHHQRNYVEHLRVVDDVAVTDFLVSAATAGYTGAGVAVGVDVSVPRGGRSRPGRRPDIAYQKT